MALAMSVGIRCRYDGYNSYAAAIIPCAGVVGHVFPQMQELHHIAEVKTRMCRDLAAQENYAAKNADNPAAAIYRKYYKRYFARVQVRQIRAEDFKRWKYQAVVKQDACLNGALTPEALTAWMEGAFPNRQKKK